MRDVRAAASPARKVRGAGGRGGVVEFEDRFSGRHRTDVARELGDFVIAKGTETGRGLAAAAATQPIRTPAYQLAVVVDDAEMGVTDVVRGDDLLDSTPRQILLYRALGMADRDPDLLPPPARRRPRRAAARQAPRRHPPVVLPRARRAAGRGCSSCWRSGAAWRTGGTQSHGGRSSRQLRAGSNVPKSQIVFSADDDAWLRAGVGRAPLAATNPPTTRDRLRSPTLDQYARRVMSGEDRSARAHCCASRSPRPSRFTPPRRRARNGLFDAGIRKHARLPRPAVSVGNITTGGTGKTPVIGWLARRLRESGRPVAILSRGYKADPGNSATSSSCSTERLNAPARPESRIPIVAPTPTASQAAHEVLRERPADGCASCSTTASSTAGLARDFDLVLVNAGDPFGYGRVLPRGMLREPLRGLRRAGAVVITHADQVAEADLESIERTIRRYNVAAPRLPCDARPCRDPHAAGVAASAPPDHSPDDLRGKSWFRVLRHRRSRHVPPPARAPAADTAATAWFGDHHRYVQEDLAALRREAVAAGADVMITTEKDWAKSAHVTAAISGDSPPIWRVGLESASTPMTSGACWNR